jgi:chromosomal replication initiator protein
MYTFDHWVATPENCSALTAVTRLAEGLSAQTTDEGPNPLFVHGPAGTGKTHLTAALVQEVARRQPGLTVCVLSAADLTAHLRPRDDEPGDDATEVRASSWQSHLLIVEDLQHLPAYAGSALAHRLDERLADQLPTVFTATSGPARLDRLPTRLTSRLAGGLVVRLEPFAAAGRLAFLQDRARRRQLDARPEVLAWLAEHTPGSGRQLEGALVRLEALTRLHARAPDADAVAAHFRGDADAARPTVERIAQRVGRHFRVPPRALRSRRRGHGALVPRQVGMYLARRLTPLSLAQIGAYFGGRDHSTVLHACAKVEQALARDPALSGAVRQLHADLA